MEMKLHLFEINAILFSASGSFFFLLISSAETQFSQKIKECLVFSCVATIGAQVALSHVPGDEWRPYLLLRLCEADIY